MKNLKIIKRCEHMIFYPKYNTWACDGNHSECSPQEWKCDYNDKGEDKHDN